jgi:hypothetical protein
MSTLCWGGWNGRGGTGRRGSWAPMLPGRGSLLQAILWWQDRCWRGIEAKAAGGDPAMIRLRDGGAVRSVRDAYDWVTSHRVELAACLR